MISKNHQWVLTTPTTKNKKGQVTIFVIIAIVIVAAIIIVFAVRNNLGITTGNPEFSPIYSFFEGCISEHTIDALSIAGSQAGFIQKPEFEPGSEYAPFSNQLDFVGIGVPYWYYVSGNGIIKEQVPSKREIERQIGDFLESQVVNCDFSPFREQGFIIDSSVPSIDVNILDNKVEVIVDSDLSVERGDSSEIKSNYEVEVTSKFGKFYEIAREIYEEEKSSAFLENFSVDVLYNYAPVTGSEVSCSPLVWNPSEVVDDLKAGLSANIQALKVRGDYYTLDSKEDEYFVVDIESDESVRFLYDENWPSKIEIWPVENGVLIAEPIGLEEGLGVLGFCYVPYHFVYDIYHPVLIQIYDDQEIFQFPVAVVIDKSVPRKALESSLQIEETSLDEFCEFRNTNVNVFTFDNELNPVEASISFNCLSESCSMGKTEFIGSEAVLSTDFPQCGNGIITAKAEGYVSSNLIFSTNEPGIANVVLNKLYELNLDLVVGGLELAARDRNGIAIVTFDSEDYSTTVIYPSQRKIKLTEGLYEVSIRVFSGSTLTIPGSSERQCVSIPTPGVLGFFGKTTEQCFNIVLPPQTLDNALSAGGNSEEFIFEDNLKDSRKVIISVPLLPTPTTLDQVQQNYQLIEVKNLEVSFS